MRTIGRWLWACLAVLWLAGCETTANIDAKYTPAADAKTGLVLFTVTHDKDMKRLSRRAANVKFFIELRDAATGAKLPRAFSNMETLSPLVTSPFEDVWGRVYVRELPAGRYEFYSWSTEQNTGVGTRTTTPRKLAPPLAFEVQPGSVTYIGNMPAELVWGENIFGMGLLAGAVPQVRNEAERDLKLVLKDYPQLQGRIVVAPLRTGPWWAE